MAHVAIIVEKYFEDNELHYPRFRLLEAGHDVTVVGPEAGESYTGKNGTTQTADKAAADVSAGDFDLIVIPGGYSPDHMRRHQAILKLARDAADREIPMASICHGPWLLCSTKALRGRRCTSFFSVADDCRNAGAEWVDESCVVDGHVITSRTPDDLPAFMKAVLQTLAGEKASGEKGSPIAPDWAHEKA